jgi:leukotriene-A4 hydrolase
MIRFSSMGLVLVLASTTAGTAHAAAADDKIDEGPIDPANDYHSYANIDQFRVTRMEMDLRVWTVSGSTAKSLDGLVALEIKRLDPRATELVLDTKGLMISEVSEKATDVLGATSKNETTWVSRPFHMGKPDPILGSPLVIELPRSNKTTELIKIDYETTDDSTGLMWIDPKQNPGHRKPFLYTRSAALGSRTWIPMQDTPQVRVTYSLRLHTPQNMQAVASGERDPKVKARGEYLFDMAKPVPADSIALAVGDWKYVETGPRSGVYAEKSIIKAAAKAFADTEAMLQADEKIFGIYRWSRFDILVMPPGFPTAGAASPRIAFISPTAVTDDKSSAQTLAREMAHAWSGNLVSNATWRDLWLTEGIAAYMESRTMTAMYGAERASVEEVAGLKSLREEMSQLKPADQLLAVDLRGRDPLQGFSKVSYEKGRLFLNFLDAKFGREHFDTFLRGYFDHFAFKSISTQQFLQFLSENLLDRFPGIVTLAEVDQWVNGPGIPAYAVLPVTAMLQPVDQARAAFTGGKLQPKQFGRDWLAEQWIYFFDGLTVPLSSAQLAALDEAHAFSASTNGELQSSWFNQVIASDYRLAYPRVEQFLTLVGRTSLIQPLYVQLMKTDSGSILARKIYAKARPAYHPETVAVIDAIVDLPAETSE